MHIGNIKILFLLVLLFMTNACGQSEEEKLKLSYEHEDKALELRLKGDLQGAIKEQLKAIEINSNDAKPLVVLADMYLDNKNLDKAKKTLEKALSIDSEDAIAHHLYGITNDKLGELDLAIFHAKKAVEYDRKNTRYLSNLGAFYGEANNRKLQREAYEKALQIDPNYLTAVYNLGLLEAEEKNYDEAVKLLERVIKESVNDEEGVRRSKDKIKEIEKARQEK